MHHAVLIRDSSAPLSVLSSVYDQVSDYEVTELSYPSLGIDEVRKLINTAMMTPSSGTHRLLVVRANSIGLEAQHALLKVLEEPPESTLFLFLVSSNVSLLPTVLSRFHEVGLTSELNDSDKENDEFKQFIQLDYASRLEEIKKRLAKKDVDWTNAIRAGLGQYLIQNKTIEVEQKANLLFVYSLLTKRGASNKMLLEFLALTLSKGAQK